MQNTRIDEAVIQRRAQVGRTLTAEFDTLCRHAEERLERNALEPAHPPTNLAAYLRRVAESATPRELERNERYARQELASLQRQTYDAIAAHQRGPVPCHAVERTFAFSINADGTCDPLGDLLRGRHEAALQQEQEATERQAKRLPADATPEERQALAEKLIKLGSQAARL